MAGHDCTMSRTYRVTVGSGSTTTRLQRWRPGSQSKSPTALQARGAFTLTLNRKRFLWLQRLSDSTLQGAPRYGTDSRRTSVSRCDSELSRK